MSRSPPRIAPRGPCPGSSARDIALKGSDDRSLAAGEEVLDADAGQLPVLKDVQSPQREHGLP